MRLLEFSECFKTEEDCEMYLKAKREENGLKCPSCGCVKLYWDKYNKKWRKRSMPTHSERFNPPTFESKIGLKSA